MKLCPECQRCYEDRDARCALDGATLVTARLGTRDIAGGKYRLEYRLGRGGMGAVYAGTHVELERPVAIKLLHSDFTNDPQALERFRREARAAARLNHTNIADTYDYGTLPEGGAYIVMELIDGTTLRDYLNTHGALPFSEALHVTRQIALGIEAAHRRGIVHRDLKPANVMLTSDPHDGLLAVILDFGIAKLKEQTLTGGLTNTGMLVGTPRYMSPEQCSGGEVDHRSDIYSVGVMLYEMIARRPPFDAASATAIALKHMHDQPPPLREFRLDVPADLAAFCSKMLAKNPADRPQTAAELAQQIAALQMRLGDAAHAAWKPTDATTRLASAVATQNLTAAVIAQPSTNGTPSTTNALQDTGRTNVPTIEDASQPVPPRTNYEAMPRGSRTSPITPNNFDEESRRAPDTSPVAYDYSGADTNQSSHSWMRVGLIAAAVFVLCAGGIFAFLRATKDDDTTAPQLATSSQPTSANTIGTTANSPAVTASSPSPVNEIALQSGARGDTKIDELRLSVERWVDATNRRDIAAQMSFYPATVQRYYLGRNVPHASVEAEKRRLFDSAESIKMSVGALQINLRPDGRTATTRFHKRYTIDGRGSSRSGEVVQELDWTNTPEGWKITGERDVRVIG